VDIVNNFLPLYPPAVLIGVILVAVLAFHDFHWPYDRLKLRYAVSERRYVLAAAMYVGTHIILFLLLTGILQSLLVGIQHYFGDHAGIFGIEDGRPQGVRQTSLVLAVLLLTVLPHVPGMRGPFATLRHFAQEVALYPKSVQLLMTIFASAPFTPGEHVGEQLEDELAQYGVAKGDLDMLISAGGVRMLQEAWSLHNCFGTIAALPTFRNFIAARATALSALDVELQKILRRTARAMRTLDADERKQLRIVSQFLAEDCERLVEEYRTLLAEATRSCVPGPAGREKLIESFGYEVSLPQMLPYLPIVVAFGLDFALLLWPLILSPWVTHNSPFPMRNIISFALAHAIAQTAAIAWAICPKVAYDFARPSPARFPIGSYAVFGVLSYLTAAAVWTVLRQLIQPIKGMPLAEHPVHFILLNSLAFLLMTICMSVLIDRRLRRRSYDYLSNRWRDGFALAFTLLAATLIFQVVMWPEMPDIIRKSWQPEIYSGLMFGLGLVLGFFVPSVAAAYLQADEIIAEQVPSGADFLAQIKRRKSIDSASRPRDGVMAISP
jgi:hypothetical protein